MDHSAELNRWIAVKETLTLPDWDTLPQLELYMDQVIILLEQYLGRGADDKGVTASTINNYVRMKVMPPPVKKKYSRTHLAYLIMICYLKQTLSISSIQRFLPAKPEEMEPLYRTFVEQYRAVSRDFVSQLRSTAASDTAHTTAAAAILSCLCKDLTEQLLCQENSQ